MAENTSTKAARNFLTALEADSLGCGYCRRLGGTDTVMRRCTGCWNIRYCSPDCQKRDWPRHRTACRKTPVNTDQDKNPAKPNSEKKKKKKKKKKSNGGKKSPPAPKDGKDGGEREMSSAASEEDASPSNGIFVCRTCKTRSSTTVGCELCQDVTYCSRDCRRTDWLTHVITCKPAHPASATESLENSEHTETPEEEHGDKTSSPETDAPVPLEDSNEAQSGQKASTAPKPELAEENEDGDTKTCRQCKKQRKDMKRCGRCLDVWYCSRDCQSADWTRHKVTCQAIEVLTTDGYKETERREARARRERERERESANTNYLASLLRQGGFPARQQQQHLTWQQAKDRASRLFPLQKLVDDFSVLDSDFMDNPFRLFPYWLDAGTGVVAVGRLTTPYFHPFRPARSVEDIKGMSVYVIFYTEDSPWPFFQYSQFREGNFICIQGACLHLFADGSIGFRIEDVSDVRILEAAP